MQCLFDKELLSQLLAGSLDDEAQRKVETHLSECTDCQAEFSTLRSLWLLMGEVPEPQSSENARLNFNNALIEFKKEVQKKVGWKEKLNSLWNVQPRFKLAYGFILLVVGLGLGLMLHRPGNPTLAYSNQVDSLSSQVAEMKQMMMLSLLQNPSASQRMRAVGYTEEMDNTNKKVIDALLMTLNEDPNINVRLMTLDALVKLAASPEVREGLVQSITTQESPLMQSAIADVMVKLQEKKSVKPLRELLQKKDLNEMVKYKIEQSIHKLT